MTFEDELNTIVNTHYNWKPITDLSAYDKYQSVAQEDIQLVKNLNHETLTRDEQILKIAQVFCNTISLINPSSDYIQQLLTLLINKNHDYGSSYAKVAKIVGAIPSFSVRFLDKGNRLESLLEHNLQTDVNDENINDTVNDLLGYYILAVDVLKYHM